MSAVSTTGALPFPWLVAPVAQLRPRGWRARLRALQVLADTVAVSLAVAVTYLALLPHGRPEGLHYLAIAPVVAAAWVIALGQNQSRSDLVAGHGPEEYRRVITATLAAFVVLGLTCLLLGVELPQELFTTTVALGLVFLMGGRLLVRQFLSRIRGQGRAMSAAVLIGTAPQLSRLRQELGRCPDAGYQATGVCLLGSGSCDPGTARLDRYYLDQVQDLAGSGRFDALIVSDGLTRDQLRQLAWQLRDAPVSLLFQPRLIDGDGARQHLNGARELPLVRLDPPALSASQTILKRGFDLLLAAAALLVLAPLLGAIAVLIAAEDGRPVIARLPRIGPDGRRLIVHRFRTMRIDAEARVTALDASAGGRRLLYAMDDDPRVTRVGRLLRRYRLDELPQLWTVLRGELSLVGLPAQPITEPVTPSLLRVRRGPVKPGIVGLGRVADGSALSLEERLRLELSYAENWSLTGDLSVLIAAVRAQASSPRRRLLPD
jgi:lipopolysaccharide/colanic/teichoic acid biosynthesis glycosyltransferase